MADRISLRNRIRGTLLEFEREPALSSGISLLNALGYSSDRTLELTPNTFEGFAEAFIDDGDNFKSESALVNQWQSADVLFQLTDDDLSGHRSLFGGSSLQTERYDSFLFLSIGLRGKDYTRTDLAKITREVNKCFRSHAIILFTYNGMLTISVIERREHKREGDKEVLEKVTLIKGINLVKPHRAHLDILVKLVLSVLVEENKHRISSFKGLFSAWRDVLDISALNKRFYRELYNWYFWALKHAQFPMT